MAASADEKRFLTELLCRKLVKADFASGDLPRTPQVDQLKDYYRLRLVDDLISNEVWEEVSEQVASWEEREVQQSKPILPRILDRFSRFPTVARVKEVIGKETADRYKTALESIENDMDANSVFPSELSAYPWRKFDMDASVSIVLNVIVPNLGDDISMATAYQQMLCELRARRRERTLVTAAEFTKRKQIVRALCIWFPISRDIETWKTDPRTAAIMPEFLATMKQVVLRMRLVRSFLQHIPRRRLSSRACADLPANLRRMKTYLDGYKI
jgi:hypothetical protein